ncbi:MAG: glycosyltransferase family 1 protein [Patescibacteria group bacterium]
MILGIDASRANKPERTGVEWYSYFLIQEFKKMVPSDITVRLYAQEEIGSDLLPLPKNWEVKILKWPFRFWTIFRFSLEMLLHKPDKLFVPANIIPFFAPKETFTTIHDIGFKRFPECYGAAENRLQDFGVKRAIKKALIIFSPSGFTKQELNEVYRAPEKKIIVTPLGFSKPSKATESSKEIYKKYKINGPYFFYIGRLEKKKNIENLVKAFEIFNKRDKKYTLVLAGNNSFGFDAPNGENIKRLGWIPQKDAELLMQNAELFLYPSLYEGFGLPILEAMSARVPVITSNCASMPEVAGGGAYLIDPYNPELISNAISEILNIPDKKTSLIKAGLENIKKFSWPDCAQETLNHILQQ